MVNTETVITIDTGEVIKYSVFKERFRRRNGVAISCDKCCKTDRKRYEWVLKEGFTHSYNKHNYNKLCRQCREEFYNQVRVGEKYITNQKLEIEIVGYRNKNDIDIQFTGSNIVLYNVSLKSVYSGALKNPYVPTVQKMGYVGYGKYNFDNYRKIHSKWVGMFKRCNTPQEYPAYADVTVCEEWHNFQNFARWFEHNYVEDWELDKDIICKDCKIYSPETCCFVPGEINKFFITQKRKRADLPLGVYKANLKYSTRIYENNKQVNKYFHTIEEAYNAYKNNKSAYAKILAEKYKDKLNKKIYDLLMNLEEQGVIQYKEI